MADETGLPALLAILETLPAGWPVIAFAEVADEAERQPVATEAAADLRWVLRGPEPTGTTSVLFDAVRELELPDGRAQVWGGGEALVHARRPPLREGRAAGRRRLDHGLLEAPGDSGRRRLLTVRRPRKLPTSTTRPPGMATSPLALARELRIDARELRATVERLRRDRL